MLAVVSFFAEDVMQVIRHTMTATRAAPVGIECSSSEVSPGIWLVFDPVGDQCNLLSTPVDSAFYLASNGRDTKSTSDGKLYAIPVQDKTSGWKGVVEKVAIAYRGEACLYELSVEDLQSTLSNGMRFLMIDIHPDRIEFTGVGPYECKPPTKHPREP